MRAKTAFDQGIDRMDTDLMIASGGGLSEDMGMVGLASAWAMARRRLI